MRSGSIQSIRGNHGLAECVGLDFVFSSSEWKGGRRVRHYYANVERIFARAQKCWVGFCIFVESETSCVTTTGKYEYNADSSVSLHVLKNK